MISENELKDAAYRVNRCEAGESLLVVYDTPAVGIARIAYRDDYERLAIAYVARLAADEQREREDAEPIAREWFHANGNDVSSIIVCRDDTEYEIEAACGEPSVGIDLTLCEGGKLQGIMTIKHITTRGQLRKLIEALKGGA